MRTYRHVTVYCRRPSDYEGPVDGELLKLQPDERIVGFSLGSHPSIVIYLIERDAPPAAKDAGSKKSKRTKKEQKK